MRASAYAALCALALGAAACARLDAPDPVPRSVEPSRGHVATRTPVVIRGDGFVARAAQPGSGGSAEVSVSHRAWLGDVELEAVTWRDVHTLDAVVPPGLPTGRLPLVVENPFGRRGRLEGAFEVIASDGAVLTATVEAGAQLASVGQELPITVRVVNSGFAAARDVAAGVTPSFQGGAGVSLVGPSPSSVPTLEPGEAVTFTWSCVATAAGQVTLAAAATATDAFSGGRIESLPSSTGLTVQLPAGLVATIQASRATASSGQQVAFTLTVTNGGDAGAELTTIAPSFSPGLATTCTAPTPGLPATVGSTTSAVFTWACTSSLPGTLTVGATVAGADANSGAALSAEPAVRAVVLVQRPAALTAAVALPPGTATASVGQAVLVTLTVANTGGAAASIRAVSTAATPSSAAACGAPTPAPPFTLAGGASASFTWTCTPAMPGALALGGAVDGADGNTGAPLPATAPAVPVTVQLPAAIAAIVSADRAVASTGQPIGVTLTVTNGGAAAANVTDVHPLTSGTASATCGGVTPALPATVPAGAARTFTWSCTGATAGSLSLSARASGTDANSGAAISATPAVAASVSVQAAAAVSASAFTAMPTTASAGQAVAMSLTLANSGGAAARVSALTPTVSPSTDASCTAASPAPPATLAAGASRTFSWACTVTSAAGARSLGVSATWNDVNTGADAILTPAPVEVTIQAPAALAAAFTAGATSVDTGQPVALSLTLTNSGATAARIAAVAPSLDPGADGTCTGPSPAPPISVAGGAALTLSWSCTATAAGTRTLRAAVTASDALSGAALPVTVPGLPVEVQAPAAISAALSAPGAPVAVPIGSPVSLSLAVTNAGQATANLGAVSPTVSPPGAAACTAPSPTPPSAVPGGATRTFTWACTPSLAGAITFGAGVTGTDANSGAALAATASPGVPVTATIPAALTATVAAAPVPATVGQGVAVTFTLTNGGSGAASITAIAPSASGPPAACGAVSPALPRALAPAESAVFSWTCTATAPGALALSGTATGTDTVSGLAVEATPATAAGVNVQASPALGVTAFTAARAAANVGQPVSVSLTVASSGGATALLDTVAPTFTPSGAGTCTAAAPSPPATIAGGGSATFTWSCTGSAAASASLGVVLAATDANTGAAVPLGATPLPLAVQQPASLSAAAFGLVPTTATVGQGIAVSLTLAAAEGASAVVSGVGPTVSPPSAAACGAVGPALPVTLAGGTSRTFTWTCVPSAAGAVTLGATVAATDANSGAALAPAVTAIAATVLTPATLTAAVAIAGSPTVVDVGTPLTLTLTAGDGGGADAQVTAVTPTVTGTGAATCGSPSPAPPTPLPSGGTVTYTWTCTPTVAGSLTLGATVTGTDVVSGAALSAAAGAAVSVQTPAALTASVAASRSVASVGQAVSVTLTLTSTGGAGATVTAVSPSAAGVASTCGSPSPAPPLTIPGGQTATLTWSCTPAEAGTMSVGASASGADATSGAAIAATATPVPVTVQVPASLAVSTFAASRAVADVGQRIDLTLGVRNDGGATAQLSAVAPSIEPAGAGSCTAASPAPPQVVAGAASLTFTWSCTASAAGTAQLGATVTATDGNSAAAAGITAAPVAVEVQVPATLSGAVAGAPTPQLVGQPISFTLTLSNPGGATANVSAVTVTRNPGNVTCTAPAPAPPRSIAGTQELAFTWTCTASQARSFTIGATVTATDANTGAAVPATIASAAVSWATSLAAAGPAATGLAAPSPDGEPVLVSADVLGDGTPSAGIAALGGDVLVGLDARGAALLRYAPSGGPPRRVPLALGVDAGTTPAANAAWLASAPATTLGAPGCTPGTFACGPDEEAGLAAFATGVVDGVERVAIAGAGAGRYAYVASSADALLEAAWVDLRAVLPGAGGSGAVALLPSAALGGLLVAVDGGAGGPRVVSLGRLPAAAGLDAAPGAGVLELGAAAPAGSGAPALAELQGVVYVAAAGGLARWETGWRDATPAHPAWTSRSAAPPPDPVAWPRDRAVAGLAAFGACGAGPCVVAGRNVAGVTDGPAAAPQLWRCSPSGAPLACAPGDWTLVAPDAADPLVTRLGAPGSGAVSLVMATPGWLYVGLDDDVLGARLYRASRAPAGAPDLLGRGGCSAASAACEGLGGNGLGVGATRIAGAVRSDADGVVSLWVLAGDGVGPLSLLRIPDR